jgi:hypothetical protein
MKEKNIFDSPEKLFSEDLFINNLILAQGMLINHYQQAVEQFNLVPSFLDLDTTILKKIHTIAQTTALMLTSINNSTGNKSERTSPEEEVLTKFNVSIDTFSHNLPLPVGITSNVLLRYSNALLAAMEFQLCPKTSERVKSLCDKYGGIPNKLPSTKLQA